MTGTVMVRLKPYDQRCSIVTQRRLGKQRYNLPHAPVGRNFFGTTYIRGLKHPGYITMSLRDRKSENHRGQRHAPGARLL